MGELFTDDVVDEASARTGFDDFGPDDFREGLAVLCESINGEARLNEVGALAVRETVVNALANRLRVLDWIRRHPEVADERIEAPIVVIGMFSSSIRIPATVRSCGGKRETAPRRRRTRTSDPGPGWTPPARPTTCSRTSIRA
jgi:hypothetical protein